MNIDKTKLKKILEKRLGRPAKPNEIINAENDYLLLQELLSDEVQILKQDVANLKNK